MTETSPSVPATKCGYVALIGAPNAGKSTLLNRFVGGKVSIVSHKVQTTRALVRGIMAEGETQIIFVDTPGIFKPKRRLDRAMVTSAWDGAGDADVVALLIDAKKGVDEEVEPILTALAERRQRCILLLNKIDLIRREELLKLAETVAETVDFDATFMISAEKGDGCADVVAYLADKMPAGPWLYPEDQMSDLPMRQLAAEITREKLYERLHQELPYASTVETEDWKELKSGDVRIEQTIYVTRESHKKIALGKGGQTVKAISSSARRELSNILERPVHLFLFVKVREKWLDDPERYREMGLDFPT
ncbi:MAG: GTPase Era [Pseudomonadota bacterium]